MRNTIFAALLSLILLSGCISAVTKDKVNKFTAEADGFALRVESGQTTRKQEQAYSHAVRIWAHVLNWQINGVEPPIDVKLLFNIGND
jgi:outer membrane murein-binding lipoprotein Lpp